MIEEARNGPVLPPILGPLISSAVVPVYADGEFAGSRLRQNAEYWDQVRLDAIEREAAADYLTALEDYISPGDQEQISLRLAALRGHWHEAEDDQAVKQLMAIDWQRSLGIFPSWAVMQACEDWIDHQRRRPMIADIRKLCGDLVEQYVLHIDILRKALAQ
jgi:hypothetical protein